MKLKLLSHFQDTANNGSPEEPLCKIDPPLSPTYNQRELIASLTQAYVPPTDVDDDDTDDDDHAHPVFLSTVNLPYPLTARLIVSPPGLRPELSLSTNVRPDFPYTMLDDALFTPESTSSPNHFFMEGPSLHHDTCKDLQRQDRVCRLLARFRDSEILLLSQQQQHQGGYAINDAADYPHAYPCDYGHYALWQSLLMARAPALLSTPEPTTCFMTNRSSPTSGLPPYTPRTMRATLLSPHADNWKAAIKTEYDGIRARNVFRVVPIPVGQRILSTKWDFTIN
jgi:hypothetical protein